MSTYTQKAYGVKPFLPPKYNTKEYDELVEIYRKEKCLDERWSGDGLLDECKLYEECGTSRGCECIYPVTVLKEPEWDERRKEWYPQDKIIPKNWYVYDKGNWGTSVVYCEECGDKKGFKVEYKQEPENEWGHVDKETGKTYYFEHVQG